ncbi:MAG: SRPBCC family protein [Flavobacteriales bacterium]|nr:SRPBCC family protein [Flavobacteriales bacterium]
MPTRITITAHVNKPVAHVWKIWTEPDHIMRWNAASDDWHCPKATNDLRTGGSFSSTMAARDGSFSFDFEGVYDDVQDPGSRPGQARIAYTMSDGRTCQIIFNEKDGGTEVVESFDAEAQNPVEMQRAGWQAILDRFKAYVEAQG